MSTDALTNSGPCSSTSQGIEESLVSILGTEDDNVDRPEREAIDYEPLADAHVLTVSATPITPAQSVSTPLPVNVVDSASPVSCSQCTRLKNTVRKYQKENSRLKRMNNQLKTELRSVSISMLWFKFIFGLNFLILDKGI